MNNWCKHSSYKWCLLIVEWYAEGFQDWLFVKTEFGYLVSMDHFASCKHWSNHISNLISHLKDIRLTSLITYKCFVGWILFKHLCCVEKTEMGISSGPRNVGTVLFKSPKWTIMRPCLIFGIEIIKKIEPLNQRRFR